MRSMTGFGRATADVDDALIVVQVNSVNRKTLDLTVRLPEAWSPMESKITEKVRESANRGKIYLTVAAEAQGGAKGQTAAHLRRLADLATENNVPFEPDARLLWDISNDRRSLSEPELTEAVEVAILDATETALRSFVAMRAQEGEALLVDFMTRVNALKQHVAAVAERAPAVVADYREALFKRLQDANLELDLEDERVLREVSVFADRCDITEELTRLDSHLQQFEDHIRGDGEIGRKGEFILQEIGREIHTIGSKANDLQISKRVIELKNEMERIREQIANVE
ncbi:YicC family protein [Opitutaceae bacterium]|nr:YicC family protein [Opitutaceae bacterium]